MNSPKLSVWLFKLRFRPAAHKYELILCDILAKFGNVQKLTMVYKDYKTDRIREGLCEERWSAPFASLEPVDVCRSSYMFEHLECHANHESEPVPKKEIICRMIVSSQILTRRETLELIRGKIISQASH